MTSRTGDPLDHLNAETRRWMAGASDAERVTRILTDRWITYPRAAFALDRLSWLVRHPRRIRMPNLLLVGPTNNGKTMISQKFVRDHPPSRGEGDLRETTPVLYIQCPDQADPRRFHHRIALGLGAPSNPADTLARKEDQALFLLREAQVRVLIIDEMHNILTGSSDRLNQMLNLLRFLGNELQIALVGVGVKEALQVVHSDDQLSNRFEPLPLPRWSDGEPLRTLLATLEASMPLKRPSQLAEPRIVRHLLAQSEGILGEIVTIVSRAAERAVVTGRERIDERVLDDVPFVPPSKRRMAVAALDLD